MMEPSIQQQQQSQQDSARRVRESVDPGLTPEEERLIEKGFVVSYIKKLKRKIRPLEKDKKVLKDELNRKDTIKRHVTKLKNNEGDNEVKRKMKRLRGERDKLAKQCKEQLKIIQQAMKLH